MREMTMTTMLCTNQPITTATKIQIAATNTVANIEANSSRRANESETISKSRLARDTSPALTAWNRTATPISASATSDVAHQSQRFVL